MIRSPLQVYKKIEEIPKEDEKDFNTTFLSQCVPTRRLDIKPVGMQKHLNNIASALSTGNLKSLDDESAKRVLKELIPINETRNDGYGTVSVSMNNNE